MAPHRPPTSTYRLQLNARFGFNDAAAVAPYLADLGVGAVYLSPILAARKGSAHGYDGVDPTEVDPRLGGEAGYERLVEALRSRSMQVLIDIVPNHMALSSENRALMDVLARGPSSPFARWLDIFWDGEAAGTGPSPMELPVLGTPLDETLLARELAPALDDQGLHLCYHDRRFPLTVRSWRVILNHAAAIGHGKSGEEIVDRLRELADQCEALPDWRCADAASHKREDTIRGQFAQLCAQHRGARQHVERAAQDLPPEVAAELLEQQPYRLVHWRRAQQRMSYRRFFDVSELIALRVEDESVLEATHAKIFDLVRRGLVDGLRIDHIDGLADPGAYLQRLSARINELRGGDGAPFHILVEKILEGDERLDPSWPVAGTTGYEFLSALNAAFVEPRAVGMLHEAIGRGPREPASFAELVFDQKRRMAEELFTPEMDRLVDLLSTLLDEQLPTNRASLRGALRDISAAMPVYRTYITRADVAAGRLAPRDSELIDRAESILRRRDPAAATEALRDVLDVIRLQSSAPSGEESRERLAAFITRWQQFTGPLTAKGLEDTSLYRDFRLVSLNEVGVDPHRIDEPRGPAALHERNREQLESHPFGMTATSTHDTKRSEDARARLNVLSRMPDRWVDLVRRWCTVNAGFRSTVDGIDTPETHVEQFIYQTLLAIWPSGSTDSGGVADRLEAYLVKAAREGKDRSSWLEPNEGYEQSLVRFAQGIIGPEADNRFLAEFQALHRDVSWLGALNGLAQVVLKVTSPGVPDIYRGCELWATDLVDPDNRRPVDFERRRELLAAMPAHDRQPPDGFIADLLSSWRDGRIKLWTTRQSLHARRADPELFTQGEYHELAAPGDPADRLFAFARRSGDRWCIAAAMVAPPGPIEPGTWKPPSAGAGAALLPLPSGAPMRWRNVLTGATLSTAEPPGAAALPLADLFAHLPVAMLLAEPGASP